MSKKLKTQLSQFKILEDLDDKGLYLRLIQLNDEFLDIDKSSKFYTQAKDENKLNWYIVILTKSTSKVKLEDLPIYGDPNKYVLKHFKPSIEDAIKDSDLTRRKRGRRFVAIDEIDEEISQDAIRILESAHEFEMHVALDADLAAKRRRLNQLQDQKITDRRAEAKFDELYNELVDELTVALNSSGLKGRVTRFRLDPMSGEVYVSFKATQLGQALKLFMKERRSDLRDVLRFVDLSGDVLSKTCRLSEIKEFIEAIY